MIRYDHIKKSFGNYLVLEDFSLEVESGQIFGVFGLPDSGKTTLCKLLMGLIAPDSGAVYVDDMLTGERVRRLKRRLGYVPQILGGYPKMQVFEYLHFFGSCYHMEESKIRGRINILLDLAGIRSWENTPMEVLPRAVMQKLAIVRAMIHEPKILVLDDPMVSLDLRTVSEIKELLLDFADEGKTVFMTGSALSDFSDLCTHLAFLHQGTVIRKGSVSRIFQEISAQNPIVIQVEGKRTALLSLLKEEERVQAISLKENEIHIQYRGNAKEEAELLKKIVDAGIALHSFYREAGNMENILGKETKLERSLISYE